MMRNSIVFALLAATLVAVSGSGSTYGTGYYGGNHTADMDYLLKQKKIYDLLSYVDQNVLTDAEYFEIARNYDIASSAEYYTNREFYTEFLYYYKAGNFLSRDALFTYYNEEHRYEMVLLYRLFYFAKDFATFYKTACWARLYMNPGMFVTAFTNAVAYRSDCKYIRLPAIYEIYPSMFFDSKVIRDAYRLKMTRGYNYHQSYDMTLKHGDNMESVDTYYVYSNYSQYCYNPEYNYEYKLNYFMEDIGLNSYYYYFRMTYPFWMELKDYNLPKNFRGDYYYFFHKQIMSRYYLERYSHGFGELPYFSWDKMEMPGYYSDLTYSNGVSMPRRDWWNVVPFYKYKYVEYIQKLEYRIFEAIDSGYFYDEMGKQISLYTPEGINYLGNLIEGNYDSYNLHYYGSYDTLARYILGMNYDNYKNNYVPSSLQFFSTSLRDPAFYRIYDRILYFFQKYKSYLNRYSKNELEFQGIRIENVDIDKLVTYYDAKDYYINNAVAVDSYKEGKSFSIKAWQYYLNYKPFTYKFAVNSDKDAKGIVRIFLGPAYEGEQYTDFYSYFRQYYKYFFQLDRFEIGLKPGMNSFERHSTESPFFYNYNYLGSDVYYKKILKAIEGNEPFTYGDFNYAFPSNLMLPKGSVDGMRFKMFFFISPYEEAKTYEMPYFGNFKFYGQSFGYPLDRPMEPWFFKLDNVFFKDVFIYHMKDYDSKYYSRHY